MALQDYTVDQDMFELNHKGTVGFELSFPCCCCEHRNNPETSEPCSRCGHNANYLHNNRIRVDASAKEDT